MDPSNNTTKMLYTGKLLMRNNAFLWGFNWEEVMIVLFDSHSTPYGFLFLEWL
jgi:hypothetical protein